MVLDQKLARLKLLGVHAVQEHPFSRLLAKILSVKLGCHGTPHFGTLEAIK